MFFNFNKKISKQEKLDFLEYFAFQMKSEMSFEDALVRYTENGIIKAHVLENCNNAIFFMFYGNVIYIAGQ